MKSYKSSALWASLRERMRNNYWMVPTAMAVCSIILGTITLQLDRHLLPSTWYPTWIYEGSSEGARSLLTTLAGASLTIAGITFSMNLVSLTMAAQQFGPRLLSNFVRDIGSQITIGIFCSVFIFCMFVLRDIKVADINIPRLSIATANTMALASIGVLIYYIHHVAAMMQAPIIIATVGVQLEKGIRKEFPVLLENDSPRSDHEHTRARFNNLDQHLNAYTVKARRSGFVQTIDFNSLYDLACTHNLIIRILQRPGQFAIEGADFIIVFAESPPSNAVMAELADSCTTGRRRSATQDIEFAVNELSEIGVRAMSPNINDPVTCNTCVNWLTAGIEELFKRDTPPGYLIDDDDNLRVIWRPITHEGVLDASFNQIRQFSSSHPSVIIHMLECYVRLADCVKDHGEAKLLFKHGQMAINTTSLWHEKNDILDAQKVFEKLTSKLQKFAKDQSDSVPQ